MTINWVSRSQWGARAPKNPPVQIATPTGYVYIHHVGGWMSMRAIQDLHMDKRGWNDIGYNFVIMESGDVNVGRGFGVKGGHVLDPENKFCHGICLNGNFETGNPTSKQLLALTELLWVGQERGHWFIDVRGHRDTMQTACPGKNLYSQLGVIEQSAKQWAGVQNPQPPIPKKDDDDMIMVKNKESSGVLSISGGAAVLVENTTDMAAHSDAGIETIHVSAKQFARYAKMRVDVE